MSIITNYDTSHVRDHFETKAIYTNKGNFKDGRKQGTYAHELVALEFLAWLSPEFKVMVFWQWNEWRKQRNSTQNYANENLIEVLRKEMEEYFVSTEDMEGVSNQLVKFINQTKNELAHLQKKELFLSNKVYKFEKLIEALTRNDQHPSFVYLLYNPKTQEYKLGKSDNPLNRKKQFQNVEPNIEIVLEIPLISSRQAFSLENFFQETFKYCNTHGEWYKLSMQDLQKIKDFQMLIMQGSNL